MRLIDADALIKRIQEEHKFGSLMLTNIIADMPTIDTDATERKKGEWIYHTEPLAFKPYGHYTCSLCDEIAWDKSNFCPNCGADMQNEVES